MPTALHGVPLSQPFRAVAWACLQKRLPFEVKMVVPGNYNSNFHQHRRENALAKKAQFGGGDRGNQPPRPSNMASDSAAFGRFRAHERRMGR